ncbi:uncharacterized protein [Centruroides vittatus]|uniref:uncharacterized protein n=1 Tax=Centruroides vittatus TaxID=120091 RepID=UPI0035106BDB
MEEVTNEIRENIQPQQLHIAVKAVRKVKAEGICIRVGNETDGKRLKEAIEALPGMSEKIICKMSESRRPRIILLDVPNAVSDKDIIHVMTEQNKIWNNAKIEEVQNTSRVSTTSEKGNNRENCRHVVLSVSPKTRNTLISIRHIFIAWANIYVDDFIPVTRCFKCTGFGHLARDCSDEQRCSHCARQHRYKDCELTHKTPVCINCKKFNHEQPEHKKRHIHHNALSNTCPSLLKLKEQSINTTDYGH